MTKTFELNIVNGVGTIKKDDIKIIDLKTDKIIETHLIIERDSNKSIIDTLILHMSVKLYDEITFYNDEAKICFTGNVRTYWPRKDGKMLLVVYCKTCNVIDEISKNVVNDYCSVEIIGTICKDPIFRYTPLNKKILDLFVANNYAYKKSAYIPTLLWDKLAYTMKDELAFTDKVYLKGKLQSRVYLKKSEQKAYSVIEFSVDECDKLS